ncbi:TPA: permease [Streptococcus suis]|nr:permease [Streptococcus suis]
MKKSIIWELIKINILYSNPQLLASVKKKQNKKKNASFSAYKSILRQQIFMMIMFSFIYTIFFLGVDYSESVGFFSLQLSIFAIMSIVYGFTGFFSVFYDSKDTKLYLALPLRSQDVFIAKVLSAQGMVLPFLMPCLSLLSITYWQIGGAPALIAVLPSFILLWLFINIINLVLLHFIGQVLRKSSQKTMISTILMTVSTLIAIGAMLFLQSQQIVSLESNGFVNFPKIPIFVGFHYIVSQPLSLGTAINFLLPLAITLGLVYYIVKEIMPHYFDQLLEIDAVSGQTRKKKPAKLPSNLQKALVKHHLSTLKDSNLLVQSFVQPVVIGFALYPSVSRFANDGGLSTLSPDYFGIAMLIGILLGSMFAGATTFLGVAMSLEKENYHFIRTLPLSFKQFTIQKFKVIAFVQFLLPTILYFTLAFVLFKVHLLLSIFFTIGLLLSALLVGQIYYWRDQRLLVLNWQNSNQLFGRGSGQWLIAGSILLTMMVGAILVTISIFVANAYNAVYVSAALLTLILVAATLLQVFLHKAYWSKLPQ